MENLVPDNDYMNEMANSIDDLHGVMQKDIKALRDSNCDVFDRYMAFFRSYNYLKTIRFMHQLVTSSLLGGRDVQDKFFETKSRKKNGWDVVKLENNPFFKRPMDKEAEIPEELKKMLKEAIFHKIFGQSTNEPNH